METSKKTYRAQLRIPTAEQYAYMEITVVGTAEEIIEAYHEITKKYKSGLASQPPF